MRFHTSLRLWSLQLTSGVALNHKTIQTPYVSNVSLNREIFRSIFVQLWGNVKKFLKVLSVGRVWFWLLVCVDKCGQFVCDIFIAVFTVRWWGSLKHPGFITDQDPAPHNSLDPAHTTTIDLCRLVNMECRDESGGERIIFQGRIPI